MQQQAGGDQAAAFSVRVQGWGSPRQVAIHDGNIFFQAATCYPCPICDDRVASLEQGMATTGHSSSDGYNYEKRKLDSLLFFVLPIPKEGGVDVSKPSEVAAHLTKVFGLGIQAVTDQFGQAIQLPVTKNVFTATVEGDVIKWDPASSSSNLTFSNEDKSVSWTSTIMAAWLPVQSTGRLWKGTFSIDYVIEGMKRDKQMGIGFMLTPPNWGFFGYLGASGTAWSYDPGTGCVVTSTEACATGLPKIVDKGTITLELQLPATGPCSARFVIEGTPSPKIDLPEGSMVIPAACLHSQGQKVTLANFKIQPESTSK